MFRYWREILWLAVKGSVFTIWETTAGIVWSCLILVLTIVWLWHKHGWKGMRSAVWSTIGEGLLIGAVAFLFVFVWNFFNQPYEQWKTQKERAEASELGKKAVEAELEREKDKSVPKFELEWGDVITNPIALTQGTHREEHTAVFIPVSVINRGAPSVIRGMRLTARLNDGKDLEGTPYIPPQPELVFSLPNGPLKFRTSDSLAVRGTSNQIPTGGQIDGYVLYLFPPGIQTELTDTRTVFTLQVKDVAKNLYQAKIQLFGPRNTMNTMPGVLPSR